MKNLYVRLVSELPGDALFIGFGLLAGYMVNQFI